MTARARARARPTVYCRGPHRLSPCVAQLYRRAHKKGADQENGKKKQKRKAYADPTHAHRRRAACRAAHDWGGYFQRACAWRRSGWLANRSTSCAAFVLRSAKVVRTIAGLSIEELKKRKSQSTSQRKTMKDAAIRCVAHLASI